MKQILLRYWLAMNASALQAGAHTARAFFGVSAVHALNDSIPTLNLHQLAAVFLLGFALEILEYLDTHPLAAIVPAADPAPPAVIPFPSTQK